MQNSLNVINSTCERIEKGFNIAACIPVVGIASATLRATAGKVQMTSGIILLAISLIGFGITKLTTKDAEQLKKWQVLTFFSACHTVHGALNCLRALGEFIVGCSLGGYGSVALLIPNLLQDEPFSPVYSYSLNKGYSIGCRTVQKNINFN